MADPQDPLHASNTTHDDTVERNRLHFEGTHGPVTVDEIVTLVRQRERYLETVTTTDIAWHGMYQGGFAERLDGKRVLEIGCGMGTNALIMASLGAEVVANDVSREIERILLGAAAELELSNLHVLVGPLTEHEIEPRSFDLVVGKAVLHHLTHEMEDDYLRIAADALTADGEARFVEPAVNSALLDRLRWWMPVPGRPSSLDRRAFAAWKARDPHPERDNSSAHFERAGRRHFDEVETVPLGSLERLARVLPPGRSSVAYRRWAHRVEPRLPRAFRRKAARSQLIRCRSPRTSR